MKLSSLTIQAILVAFCASLGSVSADHTYRLSQDDAKCPWLDPVDLNNDGIIDYTARLFKRTSGLSDATFTVDSCFQVCLDEPGCTHFSFGEANNEKNCMGCTADQGFHPTTDTRGGELVQDFTVYAVEVHGDPHFRTWRNEHFEFHGQCDLVMTKVENFANKDVDLEIQLRTSMIRYWSYVKVAAIRIGNDILEVEGSAVKEDGIAKRHYHINFEHLGPLTELGGYPVSINDRNNKYTIDLSKDYPGQKIEISTFKEFVGVKVVGASDESFGSSVGIMGDFKTGKTLARDGSTVLNDFNELGLEWQVLPSDGKLFHEVAKPQFPELCYLPEDPRGERTRRLAESDISEEAAEAACAGLKDAFDRKSCIYDILATQDLEMVGAY